MKNCNSKGLLGALAVVGAAYAAKKAYEKRSFFKTLCEEYDIKEKSPLAFADKIRELSDEKYEEFKGKIKEGFISKCCKSGECKA